MRKGCKNEEIQNLEFDASNQFPKIAITNDLKISDCSLYLLFLQICANYFNPCCYYNCLNLVLKQ